MRSVPPRGSGWVLLGFSSRSWFDKQPTRYRVVALTALRTINYEAALFPEVLCFKSITFPRNTPRPAERSRSFRMFRCRFRAAMLSQSWDLREAARARCSTSWVRSNRQRAAPSHSMAAILINSRKKSWLLFETKRVGFIFQDHCLLPQCSVLENVLTPTLVSTAGNDASDRARELLATRRPG